MVVGKVIDTFGVKGELRVLPFAPEEVFERLVEVYLKKVGGGYVPFKVEGVRKHKGLFLLKLKGYDSEDEAKELKGAHIFLPEEKLPPRGEDEFYAYELVGMEVWTDRGKRMGNVKRVEDLGVYSMLLLDDEKSMIPFVDEIVLKVDRKGRRIEVREELVLL